MIRAAAAALLLAAPVGAAAQPAAITGRWLTADGRGLVEIRACGAALCGRIVQVLNPRPGQSTTDIHNPDPAKRTARLDLLLRIRDAVHRVADFSRIEG